MNSVEFYHFVARTDQNRSLLAKLALNVLGSPSDSPFDIIELQKLSPINRAVADSFMDWCTAKRHDSDPRMVDEFRKLRLKSGGARD